MYMDLTYQLKILDVIWIFESFDGNKLNILPMLINF